MLARTVVIHLNPGRLKPSSVILFCPCELFCTPHIKALSMCIHFWFCLVEGTRNIITMVYVWNQTPRSTDSKKTCSIWPSGSNLFSRNRGTRATRHASSHAVLAVTQVAVFIDTEVSHVISGSSQCRSLMAVLGRITRVEASPFLVQQSRQSLHRANTTSSSLVSCFSLYLNVCKTKSTLDALKYYVFPDYSSVVNYIFFFLPQQMHRGHSLTL